MEAKSATTARTGSRRASDNNLLVGAYGERVVEAELLRRGWLASNVNASVKNAANFDIFALKGSKSIQLRVKTCGPKQRAFQFALKSTLDLNFSKSDFTVLVSMGASRKEDECYVIPTGIVRAAIIAHKKFYLAHTRRDGMPRKDTGHWTLHLTNLRSGEDRPNYGWATKWANYLDGWAQLEEET